MLRTAFLILSGNALGALMLFVRNLAVARLISVEDYGIAATFAISMAIVEMASGLGLQQLIVQDKTGDDPRLQAGLQGLNLLRSFVSGAMLFLLAHPIANFLGIPDIAWAYQLLALMPVLRGFEHFDIHRLNRQMSFRPLILTRTVPAFLSVLSIWPLYQVYGDYRVMLYAVLIQWALVSLISHLVAERRFRLSLERGIMARGLNFGWPLLINNILMFAVFQGDKLIVGRELGMESLAIFAMGITLTLTPTLISAASEQQFFLPQLSAAEHDPDHFAHLAAVAMQTSLISGLVLVVGVVLLGEPVVRFLLGSKFAALIPLLTWLAIMQAIRVFKVGSTNVAMSRAHTGNPMIANAVRILTLPLAWHIVAGGGTLVQLIWVATFGELCAYAVSSALAHRRLGLDIRKMILPLAATMATLAIAAIHASYSPSLGWPALWGPGAVVLAFLISLTAMTDLRAYFMQMVLTKRHE